MFSCIFTKPIQVAFVLVLGHLWPQDLSIKKQLSVVSFPLLWLADNRKLTTDNKKHNSLKINETKIKLTGCMMKVLGY